MTTPTIGSPGIGEQHLAKEYNIPSKPSISFFLEFLCACPNLGSSGFSGFFNLLTILWIVVSPYPNAAKRSSADT